jgi:hypothetical protein
MLPVRRPTKKQRTMPSNPYAVSSASIQASVVSPFASPQRSSSTSASATSRLVTPLKDRQGISSRTSQPLLSPRVDLIHHRFDCQAPHVEIFQSIPFSAAASFKRLGTATLNSVVRINAQNCHNCLCYVCDQPIKNCKEWETFHCNAHEKDSLWRSLKQSQSIPEHALSRAPLAAEVRDSNKKKQPTVKSLKAILQRNGQHVSGKKVVLLDRILDGETYGQLASCPECSRGRLKISETDTHMVFCHGYYRGDVYHVCNFECPAGRAPRRTDWNYDDYEDQEGEVKAKKAAAASARRARVEAYTNINRGNEKLKVRQLKRILQKNCQHISGSKKTLLERIADGRQYGRLGHCPYCKRGRLKVHQDEDAMSFVVCPGFFDIFHHQVVPCHYSSPAKEAPRIGEWVE